jgi:hypothetical protein
MAERTETPSPAGSEPSATNEALPASASNGDRADVEPVAEEPHADATGLQDAAVVPTDDPGSEAFDDTTSPGTTETVREADDEEGPYERDGRWWFRRGAELLVYDEQLEQWVDSNAATDEGATPETVAQPEPVTQAEPAPAAQPEPVAQAEPVPDPEPEPHPLDEAREWTAREDKTSPIPLAGEPVPSAATEVTSAAPIPEPVSAPPSIAEDPGGEQAAAQEQPASSGHWKCPSCGVINGSTASSCRMCFGARP